jgi:putative intracellular protease/amidase
VIVDDGASAFSGDTRLVQLAREFLVSDKPIAALGGGLWAILKAGGAAGRLVAAHGLLKIALEGAGARSVEEPIYVDEALITARADADVNEFAKRVVGEFSNRLEERELDEMSELSFPASDPPAITPATIGRVSPDSDARS